MCGFEVLQSGNTVRSDPCWMHTCIMVTTTFANMANIYTYQVEFINKIATAEAIISAYTCKQMLRCVLLCHGLQTSNVDCSAYVSQRQVSVTAPPKIYLQYAVLSFLSAQG